MIILISRNLKTPILYTTAVDGNGQFVMAKDAIKGADYYCTICNAKIILRKSGNTDKGSKRPHFSHQTLSPNCTPESALHHSYKILLSNKINSSKEFRMDWHCKSCEGRHTGNLLKKVNHVAVEYTGLSVCKPDIALLDVDGIVVAVIEIVVTHKPEDKVVEFYKANNIVLIQVNATNDEDLIQIDNPIFRPDIVSLCFNPKCKKCGINGQVKTMHYYKTKCHLCGHSNMIVYIEKFPNGDFGGISEFSKDEVKIANEMGANIRWQETANKKFFLENVCNNCNEPIRQQIQDRFWMQPFPPASEDEMDPNHYYKTFEVITYNKKNIGYYCANCN